MALLASSEKRSSQDVVKKTEKMYMGTNFLVLLIWSFCMIITIVEALPFPAPNLHHCLTFETCCTPIPITKGPTRFEFQTHLPMRIRPAAQLVDDAYIAKYQRAMELMMALPDTDGRSFTNQWKLHCLYCDNHLYFDTATSPYPLEIHKSWLFFPWHRLYLYFHERILAKLLNDDTFALPFWNWDNQSPEHPQGNVVPRVYADKHSLYATNKTSSLYDDTRTPCALLPEGFVDFQSGFACPGANATSVRASNAHVVFVNTVGVAVTPLVFHGWPYRLGDQGGGGVGAIEIVPHASVHGWVNRVKMLTFRDSASDPIFFGHHANIDRLWEVWKTLPGGIRKEISDPDFLDTEFTFYDENGGIVTVSVAQALQLDQLR
jgi:polyphenol oxidase